MSESKDGYSAQSKAKGIVAPARSLSLIPARPHSPDPEELFTVDEAAKFLRSSAKTVRKLIAYRMLEAVQKGVGKKRAPYLITRKALVKYLGSRTIPAEP